MGVCFQSITGQEPQMNLNPKETFCWVVGRREENQNSPVEWHLQGIATEKKIALEMCRDQTYFVGPLPVNVSLPHDTMEWVGCYFPLLEEDPESRKNG